jgi:hypothetical protein
METWNLHPCGLSGNHKFSDKTNKGEIVLARKGNSKDAVKTRSIVRDRVFKYTAALQVEEVALGACKILRGKEVELNDGLHTTGLCSKLRSLYRDLRVSQ